MDIVEFLTARENERAEMAEAARTSERSNWQPHTSVGDEYNYAIVTDDWGREREELDDDGEAVAHCGVEWPDGDARAKHIAFHGPAWVIADVAAKRAIIAARAAVDRFSSDPCEAGYAGGLNLALQAMARAHNSHPDYDVAWERSESEWPAT